VGLAVDEKELIKQAKEQGLLKDIAAGVLDYKVFGIVPVAGVLLAVAVKYIIQGNRKK
jgi:hypothetical protein